MVIIDTTATTEDIHEAIKNLRARQVSTRIPAEREELRVEIDGMLDVLARRNRG